MFFVFWLSFIRPIIPLYISSRHAGRNQRMNPSSGTDNSLRWLIIAIFLLAVFGSIVAGLSYVTVELPSRPLHPVVQDQYACTQCPADLNRCTEICKAQSCYTRCQAQFTSCMKTCT
jgi:hypothetical protein